MTQAELPHEPPAATQEDYDNLIRQEGNVSMPLLELCHISCGYAPPVGDRFCMLHRHLEHNEPTRETIPTTVVECYRKFLAIRNGLQALSAKDPSHTETEEEREAISKAYLRSCNYRKRNYDGCEGVPLIDLREFWRGCEEEKIDLPDYLVNGLMKEWARRKRCREDWVFNLACKMKRGSDVAPEFLTKASWKLAEACAIVQGIIPKEFTYWLSTWEEHAYKDILTDYVFSPFERCFLGTDEIDHHLYQHIEAAVISEKILLLNKAAKSVTEWRLDPKSALEWCYNLRDSQGNHLPLRPQLLKMIGIEAQPMLPKEEKNTVFTIVRMTSCDNKYLPFDALVEVSNEANREGRIERIAAIQPDSEDRAVWNYYRVRDHWRDTYTAKDAEVDYWLGGEGQYSHQGIYRLDNPKICFICLEANIDFKSGYIRIIEPLADEYFPDADQWRDAYYLPSQIEGFTPPFRLLSAEEIANFFAPYGLSEADTIRLLHRELDDFISKVKVYASNGGHVAIPVRGIPVHNINPLDYFYADDDIKGIAGRLGIEKKDEEKASLNMVRTSDVSSDVLDKPYWRGLDYACSIVRGTLSQTERSITENVGRFDHLAFAGGVTWMIEEYDERLNKHNVLPDLAYAAGRKKQFEIINDEKIASPDEWEVTPKNFLEWCHGEGVYLRSQLLEFIGEKPGDVTVQKKPHLQGHNFFKELRDRMFQSVSEIALQKKKTLENAYKHLEEIYVLPSWDSVYQNYLKHCREKNMPPWEKA